MFFFLSQNITANMDEGLQKVNRVCDLAERILPNTSSEGKRIIEQQVTELTNEWEKLNMSITDCNAMLEVRLTFLIFRIKPLVDIKRIYNNYCC